jgi:hypothetical protein
MTIKICITIAAGMIGDGFSGSFIVRVFEVPYFTLF